MSHMQPLRRGDLPELEDVWDLYDRSMGFVPRSLFTMARRPEILRAFSDLITAIWRTGAEIPLMAMTSSWIWGGGSALPGRCGRSSRPRRARRRGRLR